MLTLTDESKLTRNQKKTFGPRFIAGWGKDASITARVRFDDECKNGHNTFSITADITTPTSRRRNDIEGGGCLHEEVARVFPKLAPFIKWHLCSTDGPMYYVANTIYWAKAGNLENARNTAVWPDATLEQLQDANQLDARLPQLLADFRHDIESLGFEW